MATCWKCRSPLRNAQAPFCPTCGATQAHAAEGAAPPGASADEWKARIEQAHHGSPASRVLRVLIPGILAAIAFPVSCALGLLAFPAVYVSQRRRLRAHVAARLPALDPARFQATPEGRSILDRLSHLAPARPAPAPPLVLLLYLLVLAPVAFLFLAPLAAPTPMRYEDALEAVFAGDDDVYFYINSERDFSMRKNQFANRRDWRIRVSYSSQYNVSSDELDALGLRVPVVTRRSYDGPTDDDGPDQQPYRYIQHNSYSGGRTLYRASYIYAEWTSGTALCAIFWVSAGLMYLTVLTLHTLHWRRFLAHRTLEAVAAAYQRKDVRLHDELLADVRRHNLGLGTVVTLLSITPLFLPVFPFLSPFILQRHEDWEHRSGLTRALGLVA